MWGPARTPGPLGDYIIGKILTNTNFEYFVVSSNAKGQSANGILHTLVCEINVPAGINMPAGKVYENNKHASWKI